MTAIGLCVAVPAVMGYNWLLGRNKNLQDRCGTSPAICMPTLSAVPASDTSVGGVRPAAAKAAAVVSKTCGGAPGEPWPPGRPRAFEGDCAWR